MLSLKTVLIMPDAKEQLRTFYQEKKLSDERAKKILLQAHALRFQRFRMPVLKLAAVATVLLLLAGGIVKIVWPPSSDISLKLADEVSVHHLAASVPTVLSGSYDVVQAKLNRLPLFDSSFPPPGVA